MRKEAEKYICMFASAAGNLGMGMQSSGLIACVKYLRNFATMNRVYSKNGMVEEISLNILKDRYGLLLANE